MTENKNCFKNHEEKTETKIVSKIKVMIDKYHDQKYYITNINL